MSLFSIMRTDLAGWRGFAGKCRSRGVESNSDPRSLPLPGTTSSASSGDQSRRGGDQVGATAPACASVGDALDIVRGGSGAGVGGAGDLPVDRQAPPGAPGRG